MDESAMFARILDALATATELPVREVKKKVAQGEREADLVVRAGKHVFVCEAKRSGEVQSVARAIAHAVGLRAAVPGAVPVVVVPYMGEAGEKLCRNAKVSWMDLSGNAHLIAPGLRVIIQGKPNRFVRRGRPKSLFAPKSARVARLLLVHANESFTQREIATRTGLGEGYVSRVVRALEADELVVRDDAGAVKPRDPGLLLDAWREAYDFDKHEVHRVHVVARTGEAATQAIAESLDRARVTYAATGLSAAWLLAPFAAFRTATFYVNRFDARHLEGLGVRSVPAGENAWLVEPNDAGVYEGAQKVNGVRCVSAVQTYVDLKGHPERAKEAAQELRAHLFQGKA